MIRKPGCKAPRHRLFQCKAPRGVLPSAKQDPKPLSFLCAWSCNERPATPPAPHTHPGAHALLIHDGEQLSECLHKTLPEQERVVPIAGSPEPQASPMEEHRCPHHTCSKALCCCTVGAAHLDLSVPAGSPHPLDGQLHFVGETSQDAMKFMLQCLLALRRSCLEWLSAFSTITAVTWDTLSGCNDTVVLRLAGSSQHLALHSEHGRDFYSSTVDGGLSSPVSRRPDS